MRWAGNVARSEVIQKIKKKLVWDLQESGHERDVILESDGTDCEGVLLTRVAERDNYTSSFIRGVSGK